MAGPEEQESHNGAKAHSSSRSHHYRKVFKPLLEKKRRARINRSVEDMKDLLQEVTHLDAEALAKMEKADVLELAIHHLRRKHNPAATSGVYQSPMDSYWCGFRECVLEVFEILQHNGYQLNIECAEKLEQLVPSKFKSKPIPWRPW
ncbi:enhancer of split mgamma protein [Drosophila erecta]|uniref:BHLH domain-containing protein n=1 Tax=Drosophila erecta TaxID=7220 RepID=B3NTB5_DROER|nr:enhancer of split mgamma protein [Drosophila erecta]EDV46566.1 uncharacterized protein Dere_GG18139 [Drosophila erecta]